MYVSHYLPLLISAIANMRSVLPFCVAKATVHKRGMPPQIVLVRQFRPPCNGDVIELPASENNLTAPCVLRMTAAFPTLQQAPCPFDGRQHHCIFRVMLTLHPLKHIAGDPPHN